LECGGLPQLSRFRDAEDVLLRGNHMNSDVIVSAAKDLNPRALLAIRFPDRCSLVASC
jgi:hypothetical protein